MFHIEITFRYVGKPTEAEVSDGVYSLLSFWTRNGQILDEERLVTYTPSKCRVVVSCCEKTSLKLHHANKYVRKGLSELHSHGLGKPTFRLLGRGIESEEVDSCNRPSWYLLMTNYLSTESPLLCGDHNLPVPLYRVPHTYEADPSYWDVLCWQTDWKCCDQLQMGCGVGERFATKQISDLSSLLTTTGRSLCRRLEKVSGIPTYYYLYCGNGRSVAAEQRKRCPSCGKKWLLNDPLHDILDFKCDRCRLVSNIAWSVRSKLDRHGGE